MGNCMMMRSSGVLQSEDEILRDGSIKKAREMEKKKSPAGAAGGKLQNLDGHGEGPAGRGDDQYYSGDSNYKEGVVRIRVVMSQRELNHILRIQDIKKNSHDSTNGDMKFSLTSVDQFLSAFKMMRKNRGRVVHYSDAVVETSGEGGGAAAGWRPSLESIPEDH